ncbi:MAG: M1 family metallopeptidase [Planctomycetota bacterium]
MRAAHIFVPTFTVTLARLLAVLAGGFAASQAEAQPSAPPRVDASTGQDQTHWPRSHPFDHLHLDLSLDISDLQNPQIRGMARHRFVALGRPRGKMTLDATALTIDSVRGPGGDLPFVHEGDRLEITFEPPVRPGVQTELVIEYRDPELRTDGVGLNWAKPHRRGGRGLRPGELHVQSASDHARRWMPCFDAPSERLTTEITLTVPEGVTAVANGVLAEQRAGVDGRVAWVWRQQQPHATYLMTIVVGEYETIDLGGPDSARPGLDMPAYVPAPHARHLTRMLERTPEMIAFMESWTGMPFPWDRYAQAVCREFKFGGMENTTLTILNDDLIEELPGDADDLILHEIAHSWFGNLVTCKTWEHLWLNEGWATYCEALWFEHDAQRTSGVDAAARAYAESITWLMDDVAETAMLSAPAEPSMASLRWEHPDDVYGRPDNPYDKGAVVLHMLRARLGDALFQAGTRRYLERFAFREVETSDFRMVLEEVSGRSLERFFTEWVERPGVPAVDVTIEWDESAETLQLTASQTQPIDAANPTYTLDMPVRITLAGGVVIETELELHGRSASRTLTLPTEPEGVEIDPRATIVAAWNVTKARSMWRWQRGADSAFSRIRADRALGVASAEPRPRARLGCRCGFIHAPSAFASKWRRDGSKQPTENP